MKRRDKEGEEGGGRERGRMVNEEIMRVLINNNIVCVHMICVE